MAILIDNQSRFVAFISTFSALAVALDSIPIIPGFYSGVWDSWLFLISPLYGIILGPVVGAASIAIGSFIGHLIYFRDPFELLFMFGTPLGAGISGLIFQKRWQPVLPIYSLLLVSYFITPVSWQLPILGVWDVLVGFGVLLFFSFTGALKGWKRTWKQDTVLRLLFAIMIGLEIDVLFRVFVFVPCQTYWLFYGLTVESLQYIWWGAALVTPLKVLLAGLAGIAVGFPLIQITHLDTDSIKE